MDKGKLPLPVQSSQSCPSGRRQGLVMQKPPTNANSGRRTHAPHVPFQRWPNRPCRCLKTNWGVRQVLSV